MKKHIPFRKINYVLASVAGILALYILLSPLWPGIIRFFSPVAPDRGYVYAGSAAQDAQIDPAVLKPVPQENRIVIPSAGIDAPIVEGNSPRVLFSGAWRRPGTSIPPAGGNTVITAHNFYRTSAANFFYTLEDVAIDDEIIVFWEGKEYRYKTVETIIVKPDKIDIESPTTEPTLTLYTCTPRLTAANRFVVRAKFVE